MRAINIVHISDIHAREDKVGELKCRVSAFFRDIEKCHVVPDALVVSGDIAYSGVKEQYKIADEILFHPFIKKFGLSPDRVFVCLGNHDINRREVKDIYRDGTLHKIAEAHSTIDGFSHCEYGCMWGEFIDFAKQYAPLNDCSFGSAVFSVEGVKIGIVSYNSSIVCFDRDAKKGDLWLSKEQIESISEDVNACALRIGVIHHATEWLNEKEQQVVVPDLRRKTPIVLAGHMHSEDSAFVISPEGTYLVFMSNSFFAGEDYSPSHEDGYNIYEINPESASVKAHYRKYVRRRDAFAANTDHADDGMWETKLDRSIFIGQHNLPVIGDVLAVTEKISASFQDSLRAVQKIENPVYVAPLISRVFMERGDKKSANLQSLSNDNLKKINIIFAPCDVGSSLFLKKLCIDANHAENPSEYLYYLIEDELKKIRDPDGLCSHISNKYSIKRRNLEIENSCLVIDEVKTNTPERIEELLRIAQAARRCIICIKSEFLFDTLLRGTPNPEQSFFALRYWSASKIREFAMEYVREVGEQTLDIDAILNFILKSLSASDIRITPQLVSIYLRMFKEKAASMDGVSLVELLQQLEVVAMQSWRDVEDGDRYYCGLLLKYLAKWVLTHREYSIEKKELREKFYATIKLAGISLDIDVIIDSLCDSGILVVGSDGRIGFSSYIFQCYYLAKAIEDDVSILDNALGNVEDATMLGNAAAYYVANKRNQKDVVERLLKILHSRHPVVEEITPDQFEEYAKELLFPASRKSADESAQKLVETKPEVLMTDNDFEARRESEQVRNQALIESRKERTEYEEIDIDMWVLKMVYNVFRNLELISEEDKRLLLDSILNYCLHVGIRLIKFFSGYFKEYKKISSLMAYFGLMVDLEHIADNISSKKLIPVLERAYAETSNEMKRIFIVTIMHECRMPNVENHLLELMRTTKHHSVMEMGYFEITHWMILCRQEKVPPNMVKVFKEIFMMRNGISGRNDERRFNLKLASISKEHIQQINRHMYVAGYQIEK